MPFTSTRRNVLAGGLAGAASLGVAGSAAQTATARRTLETAAPALAGPALKDAARRAGITLGVAAALSDYLDPVQRSLIRHDFDTVTPGLELKQHRVTAESSAYDFRAADRFVDLLIRDGLGVYGHTLIWQDYLPSWMKLLTKDQAVALLDRHCETMAARYAGRIRAWDVVNEPCFFWRPNAGGLRVGPFSDALGEAYVARSFASARRADPKAVLVLNEAFTERADEPGRFTRRRLLDVIDRLLEARAPLDAVGLQGHLQPHNGIDIDGFSRLLEEIERRQLDIHITELDVSDSTFSDAVADRDRQVADAYASFLTRSLSFKRVRWLTIWGLVDDTSYMNAPPDPNRPSGGPKRSREARPLLYDAQGVRKPAWYAVQDALLKAPVRVRA